MTLLRGLLTTTCGVAGVAGVPVLTQPCDDQPIQCSFRRIQPELDPLPLSSPLR